jgi:hypothetical protein
VYSGDGVLVDESGDKGIRDERGGVEGWETVIPLLFILFLSY